MTDAARDVAPTTRGPRVLLTEALAVWAASVAVSAVLVWMGGLSAWLRANVHALVGVTFLFLPMAVLHRHNEDFARFGVAFGGVLTRTENLARAIVRALPALVRETAFALLVAAVVFVPYAVGFRIFWGIEGPFRYTMPSDFWGVALSNLVVVAVPEEFLYRGYLLTRLDQVFGGRVRLLGATVGWGLVAQAALFALGHFAIDGNPQRLGVFFPALLFGWMRERRGSIGAPVVLHALSNVFSDVLIRGYYGPFAPS